VDAFTWYVARSRSGSPPNDEEAFAEARAGFIWMPYRLSRSGTRENQGAMLPVLVAEARENLLRGVASRSEQRKAAINKAEAGLAKRVLEARAAGATMQSCAECIDMTRQGLYKLLDRAGPQEGKLRRLTHPLEVVQRADKRRKAAVEKAEPELARTVTAAQHAGIPLRVIADRLGMTRAGVYKLLHRAGVPTTREGAPGTRHLQAGPQSDSRPDSVPDTASVPPNVKTTEAGPILR
jgi:DNA-binding phage protein